MRRRFNRGRYYERVLSGQLTTRLKQTHPSRTKANEPFCTWTQEVFYIDPVPNQEVARIHQYLRPDGKLGASGRPDPKQLVEGGVMYRLRKPAKNMWDAIAFYVSDLRDRICWRFGIEVD
jgi:hypothetical protein